jgi:hypothetical protein
MDKRRDNPFVLHLAQFPNRNDNFTALQLGYALKFLHKRLKFIAHFVKLRYLPFSALYQHSLKLSQ